MLLIFIIEEEKIKNKLKKIEKFSMTKCCNSNFNYWRIRNINNNNKIKD